MSRASHGPTRSMSTWERPVRTAPAAPCPAGEGCHRAPARTLAHRPAIGRTGSAPPTPPARPRRRLPRPRRGGGPRRDRPGAALAEQARRLAGLLTADLSEDERTLVEQITTDPAQDVTLTAKQAAVYRPLAARSCAPSPTIHWTTSPSSDNRTGMSPPTATVKTTGRTRTPDPAAAEAPTPLGSRTGKVPRDPRLLFHLAGCASRQSVGLSR